MAKGHRRNDEPARVDETRVAPLDDDLDETEEVRTEQTQVPASVQKDAAEAARSSASGSGRKSWGNQTRVAPTTGAAIRAAEFTGLETRMTPPPVPDEDLVEETRVDGIKPPPPPPARGGADDAREGPWEEADAEGYAAPETDIRPPRGAAREDRQGPLETARPARGGEGARPSRGSAREEGQGLPEIVRPGRAVTREEGQGLPEIIRPSRGAAPARGSAREEGQGLPEIARLGRTGAVEESIELPELIRAGRGAELDGSSSEPPRAARGDSPPKASRPEPMIFAPLPSAQAASQAEAPSELRTMFATHSALLAERLKAELQHKIYGRSPHRILRVDEPEGPSTAGGKQARQAISLVDRKGTAPALVAGWVDVAKGQASLRNHEAVARRYEFQHGTPLELVPEEYEKFLTDVDEVLRTAAIQVRILVPDESAPTRATVGQQAPRATGVAVRWVMLLVIVAFLLGLGAGATLLRGG
ncbi:hypothetical protein [Corallococcus aberystwythensis]|uniref:Uncharacterized protein n=1 Tax=Corallococcus aberystwythensis TaxID=2316722 RepID=A0A3A8PGW1_9BACT|nr:hypothetical protein [Corallococcus aberystwythensis]RKH55568.1 hypothetical protein D7W81_35970 [Corallococcus aberystwythensis]